MGNACTTDKSRTLTAPATQASYFDTLPAELHTDILRHLSATPRALHWEQAVELRDALQVLRADGALSHAARLQFRAVSSASRVHSARDGALCADYSTARDLTRLLSHGGARLRAIDVSAKARPRALSRALAVYCAGARGSSVRSLTLTGVGRRFPLRRVLRACGDRLESLDVSAAHLTKSHTRAIAAHCAALRRLRLAGEAQWAEQSHLWRSVGASLRSLALSDEYSYDSEDWGVWRLALGHVREHCAGIRELAFQNYVDDTHDAVAEFCASYKSQLRAVRFDGCYASASTYRVIADACPDVRIDTQATTDLLVPSLDALGASVVSLDVSGDAHEPFDFDTRLDNAASRCVNLAKLRVEPNDMPLPSLAALMGAMLAEPKPLLTHIEIAQRNVNQPLAPDRCAAAELIEVLANGTGALRHLCYTCDTPPPAAFDALASANRDLETVAIHLEIAVPDELGEDEVDNEVGRSWPREMSLASIVKSFAKCPNLRELQVYERMADIEHKVYPKIVDACRPLRDRRIYICVLGEDYLA